MRLDFIETSCPGPLVDTFFEHYSKSFEEPRESLDGFYECLRMNSRQEDTIEWVALAYLDGVIVGGANFVVVKIDRWSVHLNYIFVNPEYRGRGYADQILDYIHDLTGVDLVFIEADESTLDFWTMKGAQVVDPDYVQPPLGADSTEHSYALCVFNGPVSDADIKNHLTAFFYSSVFKGSMTRDEATQLMMETNREFERAPKAGEIWRM